MLVGDILGYLWDIVQYFVCWIETALVYVINLVLSGMAAAIGAIVALLPAMPSMPSLPSYFATGISWANYFFPVGYLLSTVTAVFGFWVLWIVVRIPLRWFKANPT